MKLSLGGDSFTRATCSLALGSAAHEALQARHCLLPIFTDAIGDDDAEPMRQTLFDPGNLAQPYLSVNTDVHMRIRYLES